MKKIALLFLISLPLFFSCQKNEDPISASSVPEENNDTVIDFKIDGRLPGVFSVSGGKKIRFSRGNLQYNAGRNKWKFAANQYDFVGEGNKYRSEIYDGWIDLFAWGTSGWNSGAVSFQPWISETSDKSNHYLVGGSSAINLRNGYARADWAVYNDITNSSRGLEWRTLSRKDFAFLFGVSDFVFVGGDNDTCPSIRKNKSGLCTLIIGDSSFFGAIILPDDWELPDGCSFIASRRSNIYNEEQWTKMELNGAVFLPASCPEDTEYGGIYWTTDADKNVSNGKYYAYALRFFQTNNNVSAIKTTRNGCCAIRPVTEYLY